MSIINDACEWAVGIANDNSHGYSQQVRWGASYDCSSLVISAFDYAFKKAGISYTPKTLGATYTGNMRSIFRNCGFRVLVNVPKSALVRGDILLNDATHTALYLGDGKLVHARSSEGTNDTIDNSGNEICVQNYYGVWDCVLRYSDPDVQTSPTPEEPATPAARMISVNLPVIEFGMTGTAVKTLQQILIAKGFSCGGCGADGEFGNGTKTGVINFQRANGIAQDGVVGASTYSKLFGVQ